jgi:hypothetical protein
MGVGSLSVEGASDLGSFHTGTGQCHGKLEEGVVARSYRMLVPAFERSIDTLLIVLPTMG